MKKLLSVAGAISIVIGGYSLHGFRMPQPIPGRIHVTNKAREDIDVYFYATQSDKVGEVPCKTYIMSIRAGDTAFLDPQNCLINVVEVRHTPEEEHEQSTKEYISKEAQNLETYLEYRGPNQFIEQKFKQSAKR